MPTKVGTGARLLAGAILTLLLLSGCAAKQTLALTKTKPSDIAGTASIAHVPFFPQQDFQCGPASLAMVLRHAGAEVSPEALRPSLYIPGKRGSLQVEMQAQPRRYGMLAYLVKPTLHALLKEIDAGRPVVVFQNLALKITPQWHYAVVTGYDLAKGEVTLHSGDNPNYTIALSTFERTWARAGSWGMVVLPAGKLPVDADKEHYLKAVEGLEASGFSSEAHRSYAAALKPWPNSLVAWMGLGNSSYAMDDLDGAAKAFQQAARLHPNAIEPLNNLAQVHMELGEYGAAKKAIEHALSLNSNSLPLQQTRAEIDKQARLAAKAKRE